jgi:DNA polymerase III subunit delta'
MQFSNVIGQQVLKKELPELMQDNRLAHALLFLGKEGSGALSLALAFSQFVVCENVSPPAGNYQLLLSGPGCWMPVALVLPV